MDKQIITFTANQQHLHKTGGLDIFATKTVSYIEAHFDLGDNWDGYDSIEAVWWNDRTRPIRTVLDTEGVCIVPTEVLLRKSVVYVNLVGVIASGNTLTDRLTTHPITAFCNKFDAQLGEGTTTPLTPSEYEQFVASVKADADRAEDAKDSARVYAGNALSSAQNALVSETNASTSETNAHTSEVNAKASEDNAETYKNQAQTYAQNADISATNAENAKDEAIDARDEILGMSATATTLPAGSNATASYSDGLLSLGIPKGDKGDKGNTGDTGAPAGFGSVTATVDDTIGTPSVEVTASGADTAKNFDFAFHNLKGEKGDKGDTGEVSYDELASLLPKETASGSIVTVPDGQSVIPVESLKVTLEPIQDLHGYDKPWSGGAGKNKFDESTIYHGYFYNNVEELTESENYRTAIIDNLPAGTYTFSVTLPDTYIIRYFVNGAINDFGGAAQSMTFTVTTAGKVAVCFRKTNSAVITEDFRTQIEAGSTATAWTPYENICPISGHTEVDTVRTGKNMLPKFSVSDFDNGTICGLSTYIIIPLKAGTYTVSNNAPTGYIWAGIDFNTGQSYTRVFAGNPKTITVSEDADLMYGILTTDKAAALSYDAQIELGSTATAYEPYNGDAYTTPLGQTVYGGVLDIVSGELVADRAITTLGALSWAMSDARFYSSSLTTTIKRGTSAEGYDNIISDSYDAQNASASRQLTDGGISVDNGGNVQLRDDRFSSTSDLVASMSNAQLCYELATPTTIQLTPQEVKLLLGNNTIWSDGDVAIVYSADVTKWIEKQLS